VTADVQKNLYALPLAAQVSGQRVRLYVDYTAVYGNGHCAVQIASIGDVDL
jgi:hypothetical protein